MCLRLSYAPAVCNSTKKRSDKKDTVTFRKRRVKYFTAILFQKPSGEKIYLS